MLYTSVTNDFTSKLFTQLDSSPVIYLTCHLSPDDDAISSLLSFHLLIKTIYPSKDVKIIATGNPVDRYQSFMNYNLVEFLPDIADVIQPNSTLVCLDGGQLSRFTNNIPKLLELNLSLICIDHHTTSTDEFHLALQETTSSSTSELNYLIAPDHIKNNPDFCTLILLGILGDTGTFNYVKPDQTRVFDIVKHIIQITKVDIQQFKSTYSLIEPEVFEIVKEFIKNTQFHHHQIWPSFSSSFISRDYIHQYSLTDDLISQASDIYAVQYLRLIKGYSWGFVLKPTSDGNVRISLRSLPGSVNVRQLSQNMNIGGGHDRAAGALVKSLSDNPYTPNQALADIRKYLDSHPPLLS